LSERDNLIRRDRLDGGALLVGSEACQQRAPLILRKIRAEHYPS
jgi:hypothetical protein